MIQPKCLYFTSSLHVVDRDRERIKWNEIADIWMLVTRRKASRQSQSTWRHKVWNVRCGHWLWWCRAASASASASQWSKKVNTNPKLLLFPISLILDIIKTKRVNYFLLHLLTSFLLSVFFQLPCDLASS